MQAVLDPMKGEMHFLRAWMYFELMRTFGGVPIITESFQLDEKVSMCQEIPMMSVPHLFWKNVRRPLHLLPAGKSACRKDQQDCRHGFESKDVIVYGKPVE